MSTRPSPSREREPGQILVLFALAAVAVIAMVGLVLDGGDSFAQRRDQQSAADLAATAGANAYLNAGGSVGARTAAAIAAARSAATRNGYTNGTADTVVDVGVSLLSSGAASLRLGVSAVQVAITKKARKAGGMIFSRPRA